MATLVTGGTGFVGSNIVKALLQRGHEVVCFDLVAPDGLTRKYAEPWSDEVSFVQGDILSKGDLERVAAQHDIVKIVHAAVYTGIRRDIEAQRSRSIVDINLAGTANLLDLASGLKPQRFVYVSSGAVYGEHRDSDEVLHEDSVLLPRSLYAVTKHASELLVHRYGELHGFETVSLRLSSPYGPLERVTDHRALMSVPHEWTGNAVRGEPVWVGDRGLARDFTYVADTAAGICTALDAPSLSYDVYNVSTGRLVTLGEIIEALRTWRPSLQVIDDPAKEFPIMPAGSSRGTMDATRIQDDLGFSPGFDLTSGIGDYLSWREESGYRD